MNYRLVVVYNSNNNNIVYNIWCTYVYDNQRQVVRERERENRKGERVVQVSLHGNGFLNGHERTGRHVIHYR